MKFDLHSHSYYSDGKHSPEFVLNRARENGVTHLALTDHDCISGTKELKSRGIPSDIQLINGVEFSALWENLEIHIVGLGFNMDHPGLRALLESQQQERRQRIRRMHQLMEKSGITGLDSYINDLECVSPSRSHVADFLVQIGKAQSRKKAFKAVARNGRYYASPNWCSLQDAITAIHESAGVSVIAHPHRYPLSQNKLNRLALDFKNCGGDALEVSYSNLDDTVRMRLAKMSLDTGLWASAGSDFHDAGATWMDLGKVPELPDICKKNAIWLHPRWHSLKGPV